MVMRLDDSWGGGAPPPPDKVKKTPAPKPDPVVTYTPPTPTYTPPKQSTSSGGGGGGGGSRSSGASAAAAAAKKAEAKANKEAKERTEAQNKATADLARGQHGVLLGLKKSRDVKLSNITDMLKSNDEALLASYKSGLTGLKEDHDNNQVAEGDTTFRNFANMLRERSELLAEVALQGAGETDRVRALQGVARNFSANQSEINRSFYDTQSSINDAIRGLNSSTTTQRTTLYSQAEADRANVWDGFNQSMLEGWTQIGNIENSNTNIDSDSSVAYERIYKDWEKQAKKYASASYDQKAPKSSDMSKWAGKGSTEERRLASSNRAAATSFAEPMKRAEGATLRKW